MRSNRIVTTGSLLLVKGGPFPDDSITDLLESRGYEITVADDRPAASEMLKNLNPGLVIVGLEKADDITGDVFFETSRTRPDLAIIVISETILTDDVLAFLKPSVFHCFNGKVHPEELLLVVERAFEKQRLQQEIVALRSQVAFGYDFDKLVGHSEAARRLRRQAAEAANIDRPVFIAGEAGCGKEFLARLIHCHSRRRHQEFLIGGTSACYRKFLPRETSVFGHAELVSDARGGTIFIEEVNDIPENMRTILDDILKADTSECSGIHESFDFRIMTATNRVADDKTASNHPEDALFGGRRITRILVPPLRERSEDIPDLVDHFLNQNEPLSSDNRFSIAPEALEKLLAYAWPGNIRELESTIARAMTLAVNRRIRPGDILFIAAGEVTSASRRLSRESEESAGTLEDSLKIRIKQALDDSNWNLTRSAVALGIGRTTLWRKIKKYDLKKE